MEAKEVMVVTVDMEIMESLEEVIINIIEIILIKKINMDKIKPDEILNEDEIRAAKDAFDAYDKMGYGTLEVEEL